MMRYARYAAAVVFALLAAGFVALWVRSCYRDEFIQGPVGGLYIGLRSCVGVVVNEVTQPDEWPNEWHTWRVVSEKLRAKGIASEIDPRRNSGFRYGFQFRIKPNSGFVVVLPHWFLAASSLGLAALFAFKRTWRYSLRTILVATTVVAAALGWAVWAV